MDIGVTGNETVKMKLHCEFTPSINGYILSLGSVLDGAPARKYIRKYADHQYACQLEPALANPYFDSERMPGQLARRFQQIAVAAFVTKVEALGCDLTPVQFAALVALREHPGIDQATLAGLIAYDRTTIGGVIDRLVQKGLIERMISQTDRRARVLHIANLGRETLDTAQPAVMAAQKQILTGLSEVEAQQLIELLHKAVIAANHVSRAPKQV